MQLNLVSVRFAIGIMIITSIFVITFSDSKSGNALYIETRTGPWPEKMIASENYVYLLLQDRLGNLFFKRSIDNGSTFESTLKIGANSVSMYQPTMAISGNHVYVAWDHHVGYSAIFFRRSIDNGATFDNTIILSNNTGGSKLGLLVSSDNYVHVVYTEYHENEQIFLRRSIDYGKTFEDPIMLSNNTHNHNSAGPNIAISGSNVYVAWFQDTFCSSMEPPDPRCQPGIMFRKSSDNGKTFADAISIPIRNIPLILGGFPQPPPEIAAAGNDVYISWWDYDGTTNKSDVFLAKSDGNGFEVTSLANGEAGEGETRVIASGSNVYVLWHTIPEEGKLGIILSRSTDHGSTFEKIKLPYNFTSPFNIFTQIALSDNKLYFVWSSNDKVFFVASTDNGLIFSEPLVFSADEFPTSYMTASGSNVYLLAFSSNFPVSEFEAPKEKTIFKRSIDGGKTFNETILLTHGKSLMSNFDINSIILEEPLVLTSNLEPFMGPISIGKTIAVHSQLTSKLSDNTQFAYLVQVKDEQGFTVEILSMEGQIRSNESIDPGLGWRPEKAGVYEIKTFVWSDLKTPIPLAPFRI